MFNRILVPLDGSSFGDYALPTAIELARRTGATLELVHVHRPEPAPRRSGFDARALLGRDVQRYGDGWGAAVERMHDLEDRLRATEPFRVYARVQQGDAVAPELVRRARTSLADLVVMTSHGRAGERRAGIGAVASHLVRHAEVPVLVLRPAPDTADAPTASIFRHVLVPLDGTPRSEDVLPVSRRLVQPFGSAATLLRVVSSPASSRGHAEAVLEQAKQRAEAHDYLDRVAERVAPTGLRPSVAIAAHESIERGILDVARDVGADLIAMATHGRTGVPRIVMGSVAEEVLRSTALPLLLFGPAAARHLDTRTAAVAASAAVT